ncbi:MAG: hypothetical protein WC389_18005 [Lutibacter sp.]|jgi:hypothetical protein
MDKKTAKKILFQLNEHVMKISKSSYGLPVYHKEHFKDMIKIVMDTAREDAE